MGTSVTGVPTVPPHRLKVVLVEPEIPQNTGNIARLCAVTGAELHLVRPLGFFLSGRHLKRAGMDYWEQVQWVVHDDLTALWGAMGGERFWLASAKAPKSLWEAEFQANDWIVLGKESAGLPAAVLTAWPDRGVRIPMLAGGRCLNISTAAGVFVLEALRQIQYKRV